MSPFGLPNTVRFAALLCASPLPPNKAETPPPYPVGVSGWGDGASEEKVAD